LRDMPWSGHRLTSTQRRVGPGMTASSAIRQPPARGRLAEPPATRATGTLPAWVGTSLWGASQGSGSA
jgi:hypothetical protein